MSHGLREYTENLFPNARNTPNLFPLRPKMNHLESIYHKLGAWLAWAFRQRTERPGKKNFSEKNMNLATPLEWLCLEKSKRKTFWFHKIQKGWV